MTSVRMVKFLAGLKSEHSPSCRFEPHKSNVIKDDIFVHTYRKKKGERLSFSFLHDTPLNTGETPLLKPVGRCPFCAPVQLMSIMKGVTLPSVSLGLDDRSLFLCLP